MIRKLSVSRNGKEVVYDDADSHAATHIADTPELPALVKEVLASTDLEGDVIRFQKDMKRIIGESDLVETDKSDEIVYAKRKNRDVYTPFTKSRKPKQSSLLSVSFRRLENDVYELDSTWIGPMDSPAFPGDPDEDEQSIPFWTSHALVWGRQEVQPDTITTDNPWL